MNGTRERNRTSDQKFRKLLLYPLSYPGVCDRTDGLPVWIIV